MLWYWLISIAIAITFAVICYRVAEGKGRNGLVWGIVGLIFPIIGLIVVLVLSDKRTSTV